MSYSVLILEDETHQQELLAALLRKKFPEFRIAGIASTIEEGKTLLERNTPDLMFMDVMLPPATSFDLLEQLPTVNFEIVFTTSYEAFAIQAFRLSAIDYLLKPVDELELGMALEKFKQKRYSRDSTLHVRTLLTNLHELKSGMTKIALPTLTGFVFVLVKDIVRIRADSTYTTVITRSRQQVVASRTLKEIEYMLVGHPFFRVHNSHMINLDYVIEYIKGEGGIIKMTDGAEIEVSRRRKDELLRKLKKA